MNALLNKRATLTAGFLFLAVLFSWVNGAPDSKRIVFVPVSNAFCVALNERAGLLAIGDCPGEKNGRISLYHLDSKGGLKQSEPLRYQLPLLAAAKDIMIHPQGLALHPSLPLLYLWQDAAAVEYNVSYQDKIKDELDHLLIFSITPTALNPVFQGARGAAFAFAQTRAMIALDPDGQRLFIPNINTPNDRNPAIGFYDLGTNGLPREFNGTLEPTWIDVKNCVNNHPAGAGFLPISKQRLLFMGIQGPAVWNIENRLAPINAFSFHFMRARNNLIAGHPVLPVFYGAGNDSCFGMEHADGFPTQRPWHLRIPRAVFSSPPTVMSSQPSFLALAAPQTLWFIPLDSAGRFNGQPESIPINASFLRALAYSPRFDRLYLPIEQ